MRYVNSLLKRNCAEELVTLFGKTNNPAKEISESYGAYHHMRSAIGKDGLQWEDFMNLHIGDGSTGRTGATFTLMSKSANVSIDPQTNNEFIKSWITRWKIKNFNAYKCSWEDYFNKENDEGNSDFYLDQIKYSKKHMGIVLVHAHVRTIDIMQKFPNWKYCYVNPCCMPENQILTTQELEGNNISVVMAGSDNQILSPQNMVYVYRNDKMFEGGR